MILKQFLGICGHKWKIIEKIDTYSELSLQYNMPAYAKYVLRCEKCGKIKIKKIT